MSGSSGSNCSASSIRFVASFQFSVIIAGCGMKKPSPFVHFTSVIEQPDVRQYGAETVVGVGEIVLQGECALEVGDGFQVLEVFRRPPQQECAGDMTFREVRVKVKRASTVEFSLLQPHAGRIKFEMASRTREGKGGVSEGKSRVPSHGVRQVLAGLVHLGRIARSAEPEAAHEFRISQWVAAIALALLNGG